MAVKTLRLILGDQLNSKHSWFKQRHEHVTYLMAEVYEEATYAKHHIQKVTGFFLAMRTFAERIKQDGNKVLYFKLDHPENESNFPALIKRLVAEHHFEKFEYQLPEQLKIPVSVVDTEHFLTDRGFLQEFFQGKKQLLMESFYRAMRKKYGILMEGNQPVSGKWNFDAENRKKMPKSVTIPSPLTFQHEVNNIVEMIKKLGIETIGNIDAQSFVWPKNRTESLELLEFFVEQCLPQFGSYQDAMTTKGWSLFHSRLSFSLNTKMIHPLEVVQKAIVAYKKREDISLAQVEGFVRQIIGWREYMRGIYWMHMPTYRNLNFFEHDRKLPSWFWTGETNMTCLKHAITQSLDYGYAHHIQRLMVTGNFALLAGVDPDEVDAWYLGIYIDALEWVEITNTRGMSQFADGGIVGTKPYVSSATYMHKMGHYCANCKYNHKIKTGEGACPFNSLYWHFYDRHSNKLQKNPRIGMMYRTWQKMDPEKRAAYLEQAAYYLERIEDL